EIRTLVVWAYCIAALMVGVLATRPTAAVVILFFDCAGHHRDLHSFPTRRSSDLRQRERIQHVPGRKRVRHPKEPARMLNPDHPLDRKSTRLNSSHSQISYAVFCLKKKKK